MTTAANKGAPENSSEAIRRTVELLGGARMLPRHVTNALEAHELLLSGLPGHALGHLVARLTILGEADFLESAIGMSVRTYQRRKDAPSKPLSLAQSGRVWMFAEVLTTAIDVLGSQEDAEQWLKRPAIGLDWHRPVDLLSTPVGVELVEDYLRQLQYGVYA